MVRAKKSLGQNFLTSPAVINKMVVSGEVGPKDVVIEIGPGKGALTRALLGKAKQVIALEKDEELMAILQEKFAEEISQKKLMIIQGDALEVDISTITHNAPYKIVANIPYYITGLLLRTFLTTEHKPETIVFLMQKEVADRIMVRDNKESVLSLSVAAYGAPAYIQKVSRRAFSPSPKVDSAIIAIRDIHSRLEGKETLFFTVIKTAFKHKRKTALKNLAEMWDKKELEDVFLEANIPTQTRAEKISFQQWLIVLRGLKEVY